jgi:phosphate/sulfate permease
LIGTFVAYRMMDRRREGHGTLNGESFSVPLWVKILAATSIALGTYIGGWRIIKTMDAGALFFATQRRSPITSADFGS